MKERDSDRFRVQGPSSPRFALSTPPIYEISVEMSRELDRRAVEEYGMESIVLMENAAIGLRDHAMRMLEGLAEPGVLICCGPGNNGGDGFALARHLHNALIPVRVVCTQDLSRYTGDALSNLSVIEQMGMDIQSVRTLINHSSSYAEPLIVDALFGTGLSRPIEGPANQLIDWMNRARLRGGSRVLAVDTPSGLDAQSGKPLNHCIVQADRTVTFAGLKPGMSRVEAIEYLGETHVVPIGVPIELLDELGTALEPRSRHET